MKRIKPNLWKRGEIYYFRDQSGGRDRWVSLKTKSKKKALDYLDQVNRQRTLEKLGLAAPAPLMSRLLSLGELIGFFVNAGCPKSSGKPRTPSNLQSTKLYCAKLVGHLGGSRINDMNASLWNEYCEKRIREGAGDATIDKEFQTLRSVFIHAAQHPNTTGITDPPAMRWVRKRYAAKDAQHCRDFQPDNADELHEIASHWITGPPKLATPGWLVLFQAMIGQRISELLRLRMDAGTIKTPGFDDGENLWLYRSVTTKGTASFSVIHSALREVMTKHREWHSQTYPDSPWYFPSSQANGKVHLQARRVIYVLARWSRLDGRKRTTHGMRSYYVNVRRSQGEIDAKIALEIGHRSTNLIVSTYGEVLPVKIGWEPEGKKAWEYPL